MTAALVMVCAPVVGLRVPSCCRCPWPPHRLSPISPLPRPCFCCHSLPVGSPPPPTVPKTKCSPHLRFLSKKHKIPRRASSIRLFPARRRSVSLLLQPHTGELRLRRILACGGACLRARTSQLSIVAPPLQPEKSGRTIGIRA